MDSWQIPSRLSDVINDAFTNGLQKSWECPPWASAAALCAAAKLLHTRATSVCKTSENVERTSSSSCAHIFSHVLPSAAVLIQRKSPGRPPVSTSGPCRRPFLTRPSSSNRGLAEPIGDPSVAAMGSGALQTLPSDDVTEKYGRSRRRGMPSPASARTTMSSEPFGRRARSFSLA